MFTDDAITEPQYASGTKDIRARLARIGAQLAASSQPDPLAEFRSGDPAEVVWDRMSLPRRRAVVQTLIESVVINRAGRKGQQFDPGTVQVTPRV